MKIYSDFDQLINPSTQQAIRNAAVNAEMQEANVRFRNPHGDPANLLDVYDENGNYRFSIDTDGDVIFEA